MSDLHEVFGITQAELDQVRSAYAPPQYDSGQDLVPLLGQPAEASQAFVVAAAKPNATQDADPLGATVDPHNTEVTSSVLEPAKVTRRKGTILRAATLATLAVSSPALAGAEGCDDDIKNAPADERLTAFGEEVTYQVERVVDGKKPDWDVFEWEYQDQSPLSLSSTREIDRAREKILDAMVNEGHDPSERDKATKECWFAIVGAATKDAGLIQVGVNEWFNHNVLLGPGLNRYKDENWKAARIKCSWAIDNVASGYYQDTGIDESTKPAQLAREEHPDGEGGFVWTSGLAED